MTEATIEQLERQRARWWATVSSGDLDGYLSLFAEDAVWVTPELDEIVGREAIRAWLAPVFAQFDYELTITVADVRVAGTLGIERARFVSRMTPKPPSSRPLPVTPPADEPGPGSEPEALPETDSADETAMLPVEPAPDADEAEPLLGDEAVSTEGTDVEGDEGGTAEAPEGEDGAEVADGAEGEGDVVEDGADTDHDAPPAVDVAESQDEDAAEVEAPLVPAGPDAGEDEPHEGRYLMYWRWHEDAGWLVHRYADVTGVG